MGFHPDKASGRRLRGGRGPLLRALALVAAGITLAGAIAATAAAGGLSPNPANDERLVDKPIEDERYDDADGCRKRCAERA